jgi:hypothetical protein
MEIRETITTGFEWAGEAGVNRVELHATEERLTLIRRYPEGVPDTISVPVETVGQFVTAFVRLQQLRQLAGES